MISAILGNRFLQVLTILLGVQAALYYTSSHGDAVKLKQPLVNFATELPGFRHVNDGVVDQETRDLLRADDLLTRFYVRSSGQDVRQLTPQEQTVLMSSGLELFIAYFSTQQQGQSPHSPKNCLPGSGWQPVDVGELDIPINGLAKPLTVNKYIISKGSSESLVLYWYQSHGRVVASEFAAKFFLVSDSIRYHRSDTALVRVVTPVMHDDLAGALDNVTQFVQVAFPAIYKFLPM
jgi:EpsI family protein